MTKLDEKSMDILKCNMEKLKKIFPEVFSEGQVQFDKLEEELGKFSNKENERYNFTWNGKSEAKKIALTPTTGTLRPYKEESKNFDTTQNLYIEGDNLEVLKLLQKSYHKQVKMIYIDPPYNTGKDFVYKDNFKDNIQNYLELTAQVDKEGNKLSTNSETSGRYHSAWLSMMYPRLKLARNLLKDDGVIFISIDDNEVANLRKLCDEIFGEDNFVGELIWENKEGGGSSDSRHFRIKHEYCLVYSKNKNNVNIYGIEVEDIDRYRETDEYENRRGKYQLIKLDSASLGYIQSLDYPIIAPDGKEIYPNKDEKKISRWRWNKDKLKWGIENGFIVIKKDRNNNWAVYTKQYLNCDNEGNIVKRTIQPIGVISKYSTTQSNKYMKNIFNGAIFQYSKPYELIQYLLQISTLDDDIILDFFSGSATTAHSVMKLNSQDNGKRKFIMVQLPEKTNYDNYPIICEIGKERIRRAGEKILEENKDLSTLDIGFKVLKLDSSNIKKWDSSFDNIEETLENMINNIKEDRTNEDLIFEILLKYGLDLTLSIEPLTINNKTIYIIANGLLVCCLDEDIDTFTIEKICELKTKFKKDYALEKMRVVFKDSSFKNSIVKTNSLQILKQNGIEEIVSI